jgi:hypothetical protein
VFTQRETVEEMRMEIHCLEGDWDQGASSELSVRPLLELIHVMGYSNGTIHHNAATIDEFDPTT